MVRLIASMLHVPVRSDVGRHDPRYGAAYLAHGAII
jgi:hypothetical protein